MSEPNFNWPKVKITGIDESKTLPKFETFLLDLTDETGLDEVMDFYHTVLIPQLACNQDGTHPAIPSRAWILAGPPERTVITVRDSSDELQGVWIVREGQILYPCANNDYIALIYRTLWDETIKHWDYVWASTSNPVIQGFIKMAVRRPAKPSTPVVNGDRLEWHRK